MGLPSTQEAPDARWKVKAALDWTVSYLERHGDEHPRQSAEWLLSHGCGLSRIQLYMNFERGLSADERAWLRQAVARRGAGEPLQYITGEVAFRHITVKVRPGVLIPRPETEVLVSEVLAELPAPKRRVALDSTIEAWEGDVLIEAARAEAAQQGAALQPFAPAGSAASDGMLPEEQDEPQVPPAVFESFGTRVADEPEPDEDQPASVPDASSAAQASAADGVLLVADIGTGSGCIACSLAQEHGDVRVIATDVSDEALGLARENVHSLGLDAVVKVIRSDLASAIPERYRGRLDAVVSNPPYIPTAVMASLSPEVAAFEPSLALDGGADGLDVFRQLTPQALAFLKSGGIFACELHETCLDDAAAIARAGGFSDVRTVKDLAGRPRVLVARKPLE